MSASNAAMTIAGWDPSKHPRAKAGASGGGQFAPLSYDSGKKTGTGYGSRHGDNRVRASQAALNKAGFKDANGKTLKLDGKLGPRTTASIKAYQKAHGLKVDGKITPSLLAALKKGGGKKAGAVHKKAALAKPARPPMRRPAPPVRGPVA